MTATRTVFSRRSRACALLVAAVVPAGLAWRLAPLHLPPFAYKYGGSLLWAAAVYWSVACLLPRARPVQLAGLALLVSVGVELFKLARLPPVDRFRETLAGKLLLGRYFSFGALAAYALAIALVSALDARWHPGRQAPQP